MTGNPAKGGGRACAMVAGLVSGGAWALANFIPPRPLAANQGCRSPRGHWQAGQEGRATARTLDTCRAPSHLWVMTGKHYKLIGPAGEEVLSAVPGTLGGNRRRKIYGRLDCRSAVGSLPTGYAKHRVFFADEATALAAGYRPCGTCMQAEYGIWVEEAMRSGRL